MVVPRSPLFYLVFWFKRLRPALRQLRTKTRAVRGLAHLQCCYLLSCFPFFVWSSFNWSLITLPCHRRPAILAGKPERDICVLICVLLAKLNMVHVVQILKCKIERGSSVVRVGSDESNSRFDSSGGVAECDWASAECGPSCYGKRVIGFRFAIAVKARTCCALLDGCFHVCRRWK